jgi:hypothetical protein
MKVYIGQYKDWIGPHYIAEKIIFWNKELAKDFGDWLSYKDKNHTHTWFRTFLEWVASKRHRTVKIKVHNYDAWNADGTMSILILPILKELAKQKHGSGFVDDIDVPDELKKTAAPPTENEWDTDENFHKRWEWVISELLWTFEQLQPDCDWEDQYYDKTKMRKVGGNCGFEIGTLDEVGYKAHQERISNGLRLFGRYYQNLWS